MYKQLSDYFDIEWSKKHTIIFIGDYRAGLNWAKEISFYIDKFIHTKDLIGWKNIFKKGKYDD